MKKVKAPPLGKVRLLVHQRFGLSVRMERVPRNVRETEHGTFAEFTIEKETVTGKLTPKGWQVYYYER